MLFFRLKIENEKLCADISRVLTDAMSWEERAKHILASEDQMSEFEDIIRFFFPLYF